MLPLSVCGERLTDESSRSLVSRQRISILQEVEKIHQSLFPHRLVQRRRVVPRIVLPVVVEHIHQPLLRFPQRVGHSGQRKHNLLCIPIRNTQEA